MTGGCGGAGSSPGGAPSGGFPSGGGGGTGGTHGGTSGAPPGDPPLEVEVPILLLLPRGAFDGTLHGAVHVGERFPVREEIGRPGPVTD